MNKSIFLMLLLLFSYSTFSQFMCTNFQWVVGVRGTTENNVWGLDLDSAGNAYFTGNFRETTLFGSTSMHSKGMSDMYVGRINQNGSLDWVNSAGGPNHAVGLGLVVGKNEDLFVTGFFDKVGLFGSDTLFSQSRSDLFVSRLTTNGNWLWTKSVESTGNMIGNSIALNDWGEIFVSGYFEGTMHVDGKAICNATERDGYLIKMDSLGEVIWTKHWGGMGYNIPVEVSVNHNGEIYVSGIFYEDFSYEGVQFTKNFGYGESYIFKFDVNGQFLWGYQTNSRTCIAQSLSVDQNDNVYMTGYFRDSIITDNQTYYSYGKDDIFILKIDGSGVLQWVRTAGGVELDRAFDISVDQNNNVYITGFCARTVHFGNRSLWISSNLDGFVAVLNSSGDWIKVVTTSAIIGWGTSVAISQNEEIYMGGRFRIRGDFGTNQIYGHGDWDSFVGRVNCDPFFNTISFNDSRLSVYPNPSANGIFQIRGSNIKRFFVSGVSGTILHVQKANNELTEIDLSNLPSGIYFLNIDYHDGSNEVKKLLIQ
ncbi:MAG: T9SS type A sorting domain-containing protein [Cryomorphaceae bacterium]|nr:T9SS type A sorting domain-containing protein [Cryomorphaceae bacterium]